MQSCYLSLDLGRKHTGVAFADAEVDIALPLDTIHHENEEELLDALKMLVKEREVTTIVLGLPLLSSGEEGEQVEYVRDIASKIKEACPSCTIQFLDERQTNKTDAKTKAEDDNAQAAVTLLSVYLDRNSA
jgi:putative Holliday junction resolvase